MACGLVRVRDGAGFEGEPGVTETTAQAFDDELKRELAEGHELYGRRAVAIGKREATDDVIFALVGSDEVAVVHITWTAKPDKPPWPSTVLYASFEEFVEAAPRDFGV